MNLIKTTVAVAMLAALPLGAAAQKNIKKAFSALTDDSSVQLSATHKMEKDPETGQKESQLDWWSFTLPRSKQKLVKNIEQAFERDREQAYAVSTGHNSPGGEGTDVLAVGNSNTGGYSVGEIEGSDYIYALFVDPDDATKTHRYAYVLEWKADGDHITGRLAITYATTQKFRQGNRSKRRQNTITLTASGNNDDDDANDGNWLATFNTFAQLFRNNPNTAASAYYANHIYSLCKRPQAGKLTADEREMTATELEQLMKLTDNEFTRNLFKNAMKIIKP